MKSFILPRVITQVDFKGQFRMIFRVRAHFLVIGEIYITRYCLWIGSNGGSRQYPSLFENEYQKRRTNRDT